jgi:putative polyketide hydroxylase
LPRDDDGRWLLAVQYSPQRGERAEDFDDVRCTELIHKAAGRSDIRVRIIDARSWEVAAQVAERFRDRRIFLVGDNVHRMPPTGGFGGNTGIHDAHNLAWKLGFVLNGWAGPALLDSYERERRPIAEATVTQALSRLSAWFKDPTKRLPTPVPIVDEYDVVFGQVYGEGAFVSDGEEARAPFEECRKPSGRPGTRAPHIVVQNGGESRSILDLFGDGFVLLAGARGGAWATAAQEIAQTSAVAISIYRVGIDIEDVAGHWGERYGVSDAGAVLVRPDGIVGWRARGADDAPGRTILAALTHVLGTPGDPAVANGG